MIKKSKELEEDVARKINALSGEKLPNSLPDWMIKEGIRPGAKIIGATDIGDASHNNKTDVLVELENSDPIKISVKMTTADYWGNWYGHKKFVHSFGRKAFQNLTEATTKWANEVMAANDWDSKPFVGVSISFGKRSGQTKLAFEKILSKEDMVKVIRGEKDNENPEAEANALLVTSKVSINNTSELIKAIEELSVDNVYAHTSQFYIIFRPVNPKTSYSDRGKNTYTRFVPYKKLDHMTVINKMSELRQYGQFETVKPYLGRTKMTHNFVLDDLEKNYNIKLCRKPKGSKK